MHTEKVDAQDSTGVNLIRGGETNEQIQITGHYDVRCLDVGGNVKWEDNIKNLVVTVGKNDLLTQYFKGAAYTAAWYMGLVDGASSPTYAAGDTLASHAGWTESTAYSGSNRIATTFGTASAGSLTSNSASFSINASATIAGALMCQTQVRATTTGVLYSAGNFTGGNRTVVSGDTIVVTYTASA
jgi:hypothetical protein